jgi:hypothetical protein
MQGSQVTEPQAHPGASLTQLHSLASELVDIGKSRREIEDELVANGAERSTASDIVTEVLDVQWHAEGGGGGLLDEGGVRHMGVGALLIAVGVMLTAGSFLASDFTGVYVVTYGAIVVGAIEFMYGMYRFFEGP